MQIIFFFSMLLASLMLSVTSVDGSSIFSKRIRIFENTKTDSSVANITHLFNLPTTATNFKLLKQKLLRQNRNGLNPKLRRKWFGVDSNTGSVLLRHRVDRDEMCGDIESCIVHLEIFAADIRQLLSLDVIIDDVNDNPPIFSVPRIVVNISENAQVDDFISLNEYLAHDGDIDLNGLISYSISDNAYFRLMEATDHTNTVHLQLRVVKKLDYESAPIQQLTLTASDHGTPPLSGQTELLVRISNVNDNDPVFEKQVYSVTWPENLNSGHLIAQVRASDADSEGSGMLRYSISRRNNAIARRLLRVDSVTGDVTLKQTLDRESHDKLRVLVEARDAGLANQRVGRTWLELNVEDVNDNYPQIDVNYLLPSEKNTVYLAENSSISTYLAYVTAKDADLGENGKVDTSIQSITTDRKISGVDLKNTFILTKSGFLSLTKEVDREALDSYNVHLKACDQGTPAKCSTKVIKVKLLDINDHQPTFGTSTIHLRLLEDTKVGKVLTRVVARDDDAINRPIVYQNERKEIVTSPQGQTPFGDVMYHIIDGDGTFNVEPRTGDVILTRPLDREITDNFQVTVRAKDSGHRGALQSTCKLHVTISDVNDNKPIFVNPQHDTLTYYATILRDDVILQAQAVDYDQGENGTVAYRISTEDGLGRPRDNTTSLFVIDTHTGELKLNPINDKLNQSLGVHRVVVEAHDNGATSLSNTRDIDVVITDSAMLPQNPESSWFMTSPKGLILLTCAVTSFFILMGLIIVVLIRCRHKPKKNQSRLPPNSTADPDCATAVKIDSPSDHESNISKNISNQTPTNEAGLILHNRQEFITMDGHLPSTTTHQDGQPSYGASTHLMPPCYDHNHARRDHSITMTMTSHDADSGRGDSDPDVPASEVTQDYACQLKKGRNQQTSINSTSQCTERCLVDGHSDACWIPKDGQSPNYRSLSPATGRGNYPSSPLYVELNPLPTHFNGQVISHHLGKIPESHLVRWNYPANELSSIYSDVIASQQQQQDLTPPPYRNPARKNVLEDKASLRLSPASCVSSPSTHKPSYEEFINKRTHHYKISESTEPYPSLVKSASADQLLSASSSHSFCPSRSLSPQPDNSRQQFSMRETKDIVDNIEKLLVT